MDSYYTIRHEGEKTVVQFQTESLMNPLDLERISTNLSSLVEGEKRHHLVLDFTPVKYLSSQAIGLLVSLQRRLAAHKPGSFILCGVGPQLLQLLKITRLDRILTIKPTQKEALGK
jgi:anti-sigma B factor antagonist